MIFVQKLDQQWSNLGDILRTPPAPNATWMSSIIGTVKTSWPGTAFFMVSVGAMTTFGLYDPPSMGPALYVLASIFVAALIGNMFDMIWDIEVDRVVAPHRSLPSGEVSPLFVWNAGLAGLVLSWQLAVQSGSQLATSIVVVILIALFILPCICRVNKVLGDFILAIIYTTAVWVPPLVIEYTVTCQAQVALSSCDFFSNNFFQLNVWPLAVVTLLFHFHRDIALDVADAKADKAGGLKTIPTMIGTHAATIAVHVVLAAFLIPAGLVLLGIWHPEWPRTSRFVFGISTFLFASVCSVGYALVVRQRPAQTDNPGKTGLDDPEQIPPEEAPLEDDGSRRSRLRRLLKAEFLLHVIYILVNVLVGY